MRKILTLVAALSLVASLAIGGSIAYLTDRDSEANVFTIGNVEIDLSETFGQGSELLPGVDIEKKPVITNTGDNNAWVWATIAFPAAFDNDNASLNAIHFNYESDYVNDTMWTWMKGGSWNLEKNVKVDDSEVLYNLYTVLYQTALKPGDVTEPVMTNVYMDKNIDIAPDGKMYRVVNGEATELDWNVNEDGAPTIYVSAYAIQETGFATVQDAYAAYNTQWGDKGTEYGTPATTVQTVEELKAALDNGESVVLGDDISAFNYEVAKNAVINLNNHKLEADQMTVKAGVSLELNGGDVDANPLDGHSLPILIEKDAELVLNNVDLVLKAYVVDKPGEGGEGIPLFINGGSITMNGGSIVNEVSNPNGFNYGVIAIDGTFNMNSGKIVVKNGAQVNDERSANIAIGTMGTSTINYYGDEIDASRWIHARGNGTVVNTPDTDFDASKCWTTNQGVVPSFNYITK